MSLVIADVLVRNDPVGARVPVVFDSPHSGGIHPPDLRVSCPQLLLRGLEDDALEALLASAPDHGATLLCALFPRVCIDPIREEDDLDPALLDGPWPVPLRPSARGVDGAGLVRSRLRPGVPPGVPLYDGTLAVADVAGRIERFYRPYHSQLGQILDGLVARFGAVWHINVQSMPSVTGGGVGGGEPVLADFVIGDAHGTSSDAALVGVLADGLRGFGYRVALNNPFKTMAMPRRYGNPARGRHSIQLEINRRLYLNEESLERHAGFATVKAALDAVIARVADHARCVLNAPDRLAAE